jgi:hypothetical protein
MIGGLMNGSGLGLRARYGWFATIALVVVIAAGGLTLQRWATRLGIGLSSDSSKYVRYARTIAGREPPPAPGEVNEFLVHYPPLYPIAIAAGAFMYPDTTHACRALQSALLAANIIAISLLSSSMVAQRNRLFAAAGASALFVAFRPTFTVHLWAWSEPLFIFLTFATLWLFAANARAGSRLVPAIAGWSAALAIFTRYAGLSLVPVGLIVCLAPPGTGAPQRSIRKRLLDTLVFLAVSLVPFAALLWRNRLIAGTATSRQFAVYNVLPARIVEAGITVLGWFYTAPAGGTGAAVERLALVAAVALALVLCGWFSLGPGFISDEAEATWISRQRRWLAVSTLFGAAYAAMLVVSIGFYDPLTPLDDRILSPLAAVFIIDAVLVASALLSRLSLRAAASSGQKVNWFGRCAVVIVCLAITAAASVCTAEMASLAASRGLGYRDEWWRRSGLKEAMAMVPPDRRLYSNYPDAIYVLAGRTANGIAARSSTTDTPDLRTQLDSQRHQLQAAKGYVIYFIKGSSAHKGRVDAGPDDVRAMFDLDVLARFRDIILMAYRGNAPARKSGSN